MALLFDMDGVIIHSTPLHNRAWEVYLSRHGIDPGDIGRRMHGKRNDQIVRDYFGAALDPAEVHEHGAAKERLYRRMMGPVISQWIVPGVREFIADCEPAPKAVASNAETPNIVFVLEGAGLTSSFDAIVDGNQVDNPKPSPEVYLKAAELIGVDPGNCVVFEDSLAGVEAGLAAGARVVGLTTSLDELPGVEFHIKDFHDARLRPWIEQLKPRRSGRVW